MTLANTSNSSKAGGKSWTRDLDEFVLDATVCTEFFKAVSMPEWDADAAQET